MLKSIKIVSIIFVALCFHNSALAGNREVNGIIIGGGAGAIVGQAIGRNVESTVLGATVGGILGAVIASEGSYRHNRSETVHQRPRGPHGRYFNHAPRHQFSRIFYSQPRHHGHKYYKKKHQQRRGYHKECRVYYPGSHRKQHNREGHHRW